MTCHSRDPIHGPPPRYNVSNPPTDAWIRTRLITNPLTLTETHQIVIICPDCNDAFLDAIPHVCQEHTR